MGMDLHRVVVTTGFLLVSSSILVLWIKRKQHRKLLWKRRVTFKKISEKSDLGHCFGLDIGGTLAKIVYFEEEEAPYGRRKSRPRSYSHEIAAGEMTKFFREHHHFGLSGVQDMRLKVHTEYLNGTFHFVRFESQQTAQAVNFIASQGLNQSMRFLPCTGGGAHKYATIFSESAGIRLQKHDEIECTILGLNLVLSVVPDEVYTFEDVDVSSIIATREKVVTLNAQEEVFPYLLVSIGSGVSILYVEGPGKFRRVSGSSVGGGTFWGLCRLLTQYQTYDEALNKCVHGSNAAVDMSVGDIYGGPYEKFNLPAKTVASSFGKMMAKARNRVNDADIARALLVMITQNIGQIAFLNSCLFKTKRIFFVGNFLRHNNISSRTLAFAIRFWSNGTMEARFCRHEGYLGALGAFLRNAEVTNGHGETFSSLLQSSAVTEHESSSTTTSTSSTSTRTGTHRVMSPVLEKDGEDDDDEEDEEE